MGTDDLLISHKKLFFLNYIKSTNFLHSCKSLNPLQSSYFRGTREQNFGFESTALKL